MRSCGRDAFADAEQLLRLGRKPDFLGAARIDAAALGDQRLVEILPARPRQIEQPLAFGEGPFRIGVGIDENIAVIEGGDELGRLLAQQAVAEHVAGHVADADDGERRCRDVDVHLAEMALHRFPGAARGDAHLLVVVAGRAARGEGVAEPEIVRDRQLVGDVGKRRRALVGGDHEIGIVAIMAHDVGRRDHARRSGADIVGDVEQRRDEHFVGGDAFGLDGLARTAGRQIFRHEAALGADRHDHGVLDVLRLDQAEDFGAEILRPVGPADAAARHFAEAQMHALRAAANRRRFRRAAAATACRRPCGWKT